MIQAVSQFNPAVTSLPPMLPSLFYDARTHGDFQFATGTQTVAANTIYSHKIFIPNIVKVVKITAEITTGAAGNMRLGIYTHDTTTGLPGALVSGSDAGNVDTTSIAVVSSTINVTLSPGWYWLSTLYSATPTVRAWTVGAGAARPGHYTANTSAACVNNVATTATQLFSALPLAQTTPAYNVAAANYHRVILET